MTTTLPTLYSDPQSAWDREARRWTIADDAPVLDADAAFVTFPRRPHGGRGQADMLARYGEGGQTWFTGHLHGVPRPGQVLKLARLAPVMQRQAYGPPECVRIDVDVYGTATVIDSPWYERGGQPSRTFRVETDRGDVFDVDYWAEVTQA